MTARELTYRLSRRRYVVIDTDAPGHIFRLAILGKPQKTRPGQCWAVTVIKEDSLRLFEVYAGARLDEIAKPMEQPCFTFRNDTDLTITLKGFPAILAKSTVNLRLGDGRWEATGGT